MSDYLKIGEFAKELGVSIQTLRNWDKVGTLKPEVVTAGGTRYYSKYQLTEYLSRSINIDRCTLAFSRNNLSLLEQYLIASGTKYKLVTDAVSLVDLIERGSVDRVVFFCKEDLLLEEEILTIIAKYHGVAIDFVREVA